MKRPTSSIAISPRRSVRLSAVQLNGSISRLRASTSEIAAARAVEGARLDQQEIGDEHAVRRDVIDAADQIAERRMQFLDQRRADARRFARSGH